MNFATTKRRILQYLEYKHITTTIFFQKTGIKRGFLDSDKLNGAVSDLFIAKIIAVFQDISLDWLLTGEGEMLKSSDVPSDFKPLTSHKIKDNTRQQPLNNTHTAYLQAENEELKKQISILILENKSLIKENGRLEGKLDSAYELIESLKKENPAPGLFRAVK